MRKNGNWKTVFGYSWSKNVDVCLCVPRWCLNNRTWQAGLVNIGNKLLVWPSDVLSEDLTTLKTVCEDRNGKGRGGHTGRNARVTPVIALRWHIRKDHVMISAVTGTSWHIFLLERKEVTRIKCFQDKHDFVSFSSSFSFPRKRLFSS